MLAEWVFSGQRFTKVSSEPGVRDCSQGSVMARAVCLHQSSALFLLAPLLSMDALTANRAFLSEILVLEWLVTCS